MNSEIRETQSSNENFLSVEDVIKPLKTRLKKSNVSLRKLFEKYDKNGNRSLSAEEIGVGLSTDYKI